jgi:hypothetical protein
MRTYEKPVRRRIVGYSDATYITKLEPGQPFIIINRISYGDKLIGSIIQYDDIIHGLPEQLLQNLNSGDAVLQMKFDNSSVEIYASDRSETIFRGLKTISLEIMNEEQIRDYCLKRVGYEAAAASFLDAASSATEAYYNNISQTANAVTEGLARFRHDNPEYTTKYPAGFSEKFVTQIYQHL